MKRKNVLIYPGNAYNALEAYECLKYSVRYRPILGNHGYTHGLYMTDDCFTDLPLITDPKFVEKFNKFIAEKDISFIIPTHDSVCEWLMGIEGRIGARIVCSPCETTHICRYKRLTYATLSSYDFTPIVYNNIDRIKEYPVFAKDNVGQGGKKAFLANDYEELSIGLEANSKIDYVITEYLPGTEITIDCFTDRHGTLLYSQPRERVTILDGMSGTARLISLTDELLHICESINKHIKFRGVWYIQCRKDRNGKYKLLELSSRLSGTFGLIKNLDINLPLLALTDAEDLNVSIVPNNYKIECDRGYRLRYKLDIEFDRVYIDFDDTLIFDRKIYNPIAFAFLMKCKNEGKEIILLTKHEYNIHDTIKQIQISEGFFDKIVLVQAGRSKADYIIEDGKKSILVDNSFADRHSIKGMMPTFDVCNIEALMDM